MKRYIITAEELYRVIGRTLFEQLEKIEVPEGATHFARKATMRDHDYPLSEGLEIAECVVGEIPG